MKITVHRIKNLSIALYSARLLADGKDIAQLGNGETKDVEIPAGTKDLMVRTGIYYSNIIEAKSLAEGDILTIAPKHKIGFLTVVGTGAVSAALSSMIDLPGYGWAIIIAACMVFMLSQRRNWILTKGPLAAE